MAIKPEKHFFNHYTMLNCIRYFNENKIYTSTFRIRECYESKGRVNYYNTLKELENDGKIKKTARGWMIQ